MCRGVSATGSAAATWYFSHSPVRTVNGSAASPCAACTRQSGSSFWLEVFGAPVSVCHSVHEPQRAHSDCAHVSIFKCLDLRVRACEYIFMLARASPCVYRRACECAAPHGDLASRTTVSDHLYAPLAAAHVRAFPFRRKPDGRVHTGSASQWWCANECRHHISCRVNICTSVQNRA